LFKTSKVCQFCPFYSILVLKNYIKKIPTPKWI
jgi:hypothetical protein